MTAAITLRRPLAFRLCLAIAVTSCGTTGSALAQPGVDAEPPEELATASSPSLHKGAEHWTLGAGAAARPGFLGSDRYQAEPVPLVDVRLGRFFAKSGEGIGLDILQMPNFRAGVSINWMQGYDQHDAPAGLDKVKDALGARTFVSFRLKGTTMTVAATQAVTDSKRGLLVSAGLAHPIVSSRRLAVVPSVVVTWANTNYMVSYFGVDASEAARSRFTEYQPGAGLRDVSARLSANYMITDRIGVVTFVGVSHLLGNAARSPFIERKTQPLALLGLTYTF